MSSEINLQLYGFVMLDLSYKAKIRLYFPGKISLKNPVKLENKQVHYLINVIFTLAPSLVDIKLITPLLKDRDHHKTGLSNDPLKLTSESIKKLKLSFFKVNLFVIKLISDLLLSFLL